MTLLPTSPTSLRCCSIGGPRTRRSCPSKKLPIEAAALATHLNPGDMEAAWQNGLADEVARAFEEQLRLFQLQGTAMDPAQMNAKFADSTSEGVYRDMEENLGGVEKHIGLAAANVYEGSAATLQTLMRCSRCPTSGASKTTPKGEWKFVVNPDLGQPRPR